MAKQTNCLDCDWHHWHVLHVDDRADLYCLQTDDEFEDKARLIREYQRYSEARRTKPPAWCLKKGEERDG